MALVSVDIRGFRSLDRVRFEFDPAANYLFGPNGSGKTSVLEAIHYSATGRSFRTRRDRELLRFGSELLSVTAEDERGRVGQVVFDGREKRFELDGRPLDRLSDFFGWLSVVPLLLSDSELVTGPPGRRREFLDIVGAKIDRTHIRRLNAYRRALAQYNRLLAARASGEQVEVWEAEVARSGVALSRGRDAVVPRLLQRAGELAAELVGRPVQYRFFGNVNGTGSAGVEPDEGDGAEPEGGRAGQGEDAPVSDCPAGPVPALKAKLAASRKQAVECGFAVVGPHRDEISIRLEGRPVRRFGSSGEQRAAATALRLAEADLLREQAGRPAVFLMDEIASEHDAERSAMLFELAGRAGQVLYAAARPFAAGGRVFKLGDGETG